MYELSQICCSITLKSFLEIENPVQSPNGDVYDEEAINAWISNGGGTDPITGKTLTADMLVPGHVIKQASEGVKELIQTHNNLTDKCNKIITYCESLKATIEEKDEKIDELAVENQQLKESLKQKDKEIEELKKQQPNPNQWTPEIAMLKETLKKRDAQIDEFIAQTKLLTTKNQALEKTIQNKDDKIGELIKQSDQLANENKALKQENAILNKGFCNEVWLTYGGDIEKKLRERPSRDESRNKTLRAYADGIKRAKTDEEVRTAIHNIAPFKDSKVTESLSGPRSFFGLSSRTSQMPEEFICHVRKGRPGLL